MPPTPDDETLREIESLLASLEIPSDPAPPAPASPNEGDWVVAVEPARLDSKY
jgi:hypothetical protein